MDSPEGKIDMGLMPEHAGITQKNSQSVRLIRMIGIFCGATIAQSGRAGHEVRYCLLTS